ncbi:hypothetical protein [Streptomyces sp. NPDC048172]|uniref:hypothetical protein n=1 Tax=Streptomyces sp. NPDC048172 TaxID=3365505 RepID=UPI003722C20E
MPSEEPPQPPVPRTGRVLALVVAAVVLCGALGVGGWLLVRNDGDDGRGGGEGRGARGTTSAARTPTERESDPEPKDEPSTPTTPTPTPTPSPTALEAPLGFEVAEGPDGQSLFVPEGWARTEPKDRVVAFASSDGGEQLQVFWVEDSTPVESVTLAEGYVSGKPGYERLGLRELEDGSGELEYRFESAEFGARHVLDHRFVAPNGEPYALVATGPDTDRSAQRDLVETARASFGVVQEGVSDDKSALLGR